MTEIFTLAIYHHPCRDRPPPGQGEKPGVVGIGILTQALPEHQLCAEALTSPLVYKPIGDPAPSLGGVICPGCVCVCVQVTNGTKDTGICDVQALLEAF